jgi:hypothetical protein
MKTATAVDTLEKELRGIFGARLQSLVAYGERTRATTHAAHEPQEHGHAHGDSAAAVQTLVTVETLTAEDLRACAGRVAAWQEAGLATPLLLAAHEFARSLDAFPLEFGAIIADHTVVVGRSPFDGLTVDAADLRRAVEVQARSHLLHLREGFLETRGRPEAVALLIEQSAPAFAALLSSLARLDGQPSHDAAAAARHVERRLSVPGGVVSEVAALAGPKEISSQDAVRVFPSYLDAVEKLVSYIDQWSRP